MDPFLHDIMINNMEKMNFSSSPYQLWEQKPEDHGHNPPNNNLETENYAETRRSPLSPIRKIGSAIIRISRIQHLLHNTSRHNQAAPSQQLPPKNEIESSSEEPTYDQEPAEQQEIPGATKERLEKYGSQEEDLISAMDSYRKKVKSNYRNERAQELTELAFNEKLTQIAEVESVAATDDPRVEKRAESFEGVEVPIFDIKGYPLSFIQHNLKFKAGHNTFGSKTAEDVIAEPSIWAAPENEDNYTYSVTMILFVHSPTP